MKPKDLFMVVCVLCALCVAGCEKHEQINEMPYEPAHSTEQTLIGKWYWISGGDALISSSALTSEKTNAMRCLCFNADSTFQSIEKNKIIDSGRFMIELPANTLNLLGTTEVKYEYVFTGNDTISLLEAGIVGTTYTLWIRIK